MSTDPIAEARLSLAVVMRMAADLPAKLAALDSEQLEALLCAQRIAGHALEDKPALEPARQMAMSLWAVVHAEQTRRLHAGVAESRELERVFSLEAETE